MILNQVSIPTLGSMLYRWGRYGLSDSSISKMLQLWSGTTLQDLLDERGRWPRRELWQVAKRLGYKSTLAMLTDARRTQCFEIIATSTGEVQSVASPVWHAAHPKVPQNGSALNNNSNNNNPTGSNAGALVEESTPELWALKRDHAAARQLVQDYFTWLLRQSDATHTAVVRQLLELCQHPRDAQGHLIADQQLDDSQAKELLDHLILTQLVPYMADNKTFFKPDFMRDPSKRIFWLRNLFRPRFLNRMVGNARRHLKRQSFAIVAEARRIEQDAHRQHHPLSPFEWSDPDGQRYYDYNGGVQHIPADAAPRPSESSLYNFITSDWQ